jgi:hypothetical protein
MQHPTPIPSTGFGYKTIEPRTSPCLARPLDLLKSDPSLAFAQFRIEASAGL